MKKTELFMAVNDRGKVLDAPVLWVARAWAEETSRRAYLLFRHHPTEPAGRLLIGGGQRSTARRQGKMVRFWARLGAREMKRAMERERAHQRAA